MSFKRKFFYFIYNFLGKYLPRTYMPYAFGSGRFRRFLIENSVDCCGDGLVLQSNVLISPFVEIGKNVEINEFCRIRSNVSIGDDVLIAPNVQLISVNHRFSDLKLPISRQGEDQGFIVIGDGAWIGTASIILPNVRIGKGSIVGAGSIVTKDVSDYSIVGGNPAKFIKSRC
ncbi:acyltransferase [Marinobacter sp.]|uniref:acyltransferase n=1 Tax=Marinobacter sp. TaxID=50741 RepID=UPI001B7CA237|nr:acyltransferase [Marinobacter sp.]MBQ0831295.1 acyltransferase [Marinobacter sp.]